MSRSSGEKAVEAGEAGTRPESTATVPPDTNDNKRQQDEEAAAPAVEMSVLYATTSAVEPVPPPDGGLKAWTQVAMAWIAVFLTWGYINSFGAFQAYYLTTLPESPSTVSWIGAVQLWFTFFAGAFSGRLLDAGYFLPTFLLGAALHLLGVFLMSIADGSFWKLMLTQGFLTGLGNGIMFTPCIALVATYFDSKRALAVGLVTTGNSAGGLVYPALVRGALPQVGFAWTARILGFLNLAGLVLVVIFLRPWLPPRRAGPVIELSAFTEPTYLAYVGGLFTFVWGQYYTLFYVSFSSRSFCP